MVIPIAQFKQHSDAELDSKIAEDAAKVVRWFGELEAVMKSKGVKIQINFGTPDHHSSTMWYDNVLLALDVLAIAVRRMEDKR